MSGHDTVHRRIHREIHDPTPALDAVVEPGERPPPRSHAIARTLDAR